MGEDMLYEMRIPPGITERIMAEVITKFDLELKTTDDGPLLYGKKENLENAQDHIVKALNQRIKELEKND
ncbi:MAG: hypothetical protein KO318_00170 [Methanobacterium sp.]|uniref:Uncharacterized protein n=2 Tax=Methanobacteriaceae TaxID=2159 RepID=A0A2H4VFE5_9EURY|nr:MULTISPECIES: hypothetical protein [Methanobacterium]MBW4258112.1 hypothetical protein [Methanobacterium sp. YSL]PKL73113.1 MAG: hypothetical protein CVV29_05235 [Methanobacteriales archaeon HGW-Methanobacteriales-2]AUB56780.1 hypothetical protein BK007_07060 [Methanobacterium subterraneum]AUB59037.1 hypothetical protein BK008_02025 [Methanobacterium sp. MZ-A1]AUB61465.1 hypothetical protein BK009_06435 [Methanobacterium subterraneum]